MIAVGAERVRLDDVGAGAHVGLVHFGDEIRLRQVQLVERAVQEDARAYSIVPIAPSQTSTRLVELLEKGRLWIIDHYNTYDRYSQTSARRRSADTTATPDRGRPIGRPARSCSEKR